MSCRIAEAAIRGAPVIQCGYCHRSADRARAGVNGKARSTELHAVGEGRSSAAAQRNGYRDTRAAPRRIRGRQAKAPVNSLDAYLAVCISLTNDEVF